MVTELCIHGELLDIVAKTGAFEESLARYYIKNILEGLQYLHSKGISHWDIKLDNIFVDKFCNAKIGDFGHSTEKE